MGTGPSTFSGVAIAALLALWLVGAGCEPFRSSDPPAASGDAGPGARGGVDAATDASTPSADASSGTKGLHAICRAVGECAAGLVCVIETGSATGDGLCLATCSTAATCPKEGGASYRCAAADGSQGPLVCLAICEPQGGSAACGPAAKCAFEEPFRANNPTRCIPLRPDSGKLTCPGGRHDECAPGWFCVEGRCREWCRRGTADCAAGRECGGGISGPTVSAVQYAYCVP